MQQQRPEMLQLFADNIYGRLPGKPKDLRFVVTAIDSSALGGKAIRKQVPIFFTGCINGIINENTALHESLRRILCLFLRALTFMVIKRSSNDPGINLSTHWVQNGEKHTENNHATESSRGSDAGKWPVEEIIQRGYAVATAYYGDLEPDFPEGWKTGIRSTMKVSPGMNEQE